MVKCDLRLEAKSAGRVVWYICNNKDHPAYKQIIKPQTCHKCLEIMQTGIAPERLKKVSGEPLTINPDGTLIYRWTGWEPPPCPPGYQRKSSDLESPGAWVLEPKEPTCKHLKLIPAEKGACGYIRVKRKCLLVGSYVGPMTCGTCTRKEPQDAITQDV